MAATGTVGHSHAAKEKTRAAAAKPAGSAQQSTSTQKASTTATRDAADGARETRQKAEAGASAAAKDGAKATAAKQGATTVTRNRAAAAAPVDMKATGSMAGMTAAEHATMAAAGAAGHGHDAGHIEPQNPGENDPRFLAGTTGPTKKKGQAQTVAIPDGAGFGGLAGRKQNAGDKAQNNYSVTDANFNPKLGLLAKDPDTGEDMNYVKHIQTYNAAGYVKTFAPDEYRRMVANQDAGKGTVLGAASYAMGLVTTPDPALEGVNLAAIPERIPGTDRDAKEYVKNPKDARGQNWARMHHPESAWDMYATLTSNGVDGETALKLASDDGVSGAGRLNGYNNQDGGNSFNAGEVEVFKEGARLEQQTGLPIVQMMMSGHDHTDLDPAAMTNPNANRIIGFAANDRSASPERAAAIRDALLNGALDEGGANKQAAKAGDGGGSTVNKAAAAGAGAAAHSHAAAGAAGHDHGAGGAGAAGHDHGAGGAGAAGHDHAGAATAAGHSHGGTAGVQRAQAGDGAARAAGGGGTTNRAALDYRPPSYNLPQVQHASHGPEVLNPAAGDARFLAGTTGPVVREGQAQTVKIPDGVGFGGQRGRQQNAGDRAQNNYSVTDANFNPQLGLLPANPDTGEPLNYVQHIQTYNAAGYLHTFAPELYAALVERQNAGQGSILGAAAYLMGLVQTPDPAIQGLPQELIDSIPAKVPGSPVDARTYVMSAKDITGQDWARMHHPESAWDMYKNLVEAGVDWQTAMIFAGDDGVSGSGRLNGYNNQDGNDSFNADEAAVFRLAAEYERETGIPVMQIMMSGHDHTGLDDSAKTTPRINRLLGIDPNDVSASPERAAALAQALLANQDGINIGNTGKFEAKHQFILNAAQGEVQPIATGAATGGGYGMAGAGAVATGMGAMGGMHGGAGHAH